MTYYKAGDWNAICALCGGKFKASELVWNSQIQDWVCREDWESRHPQERVRVIEDDQSVPFVRADPEPVFDQAHYESGDLSDPVNPFYPKDHSQ